MDSRHLFGMEVELEGMRGHPDTISDDLRSLDLPWVATEDGTLRDGGIELVSRDIQSQKSLATIDEVVDELDITDENCTFRCSTHIHVDVRDMGLVERFIFTCLLLSNDQRFFDLAGEGRERSMYCVPSCNPLNSLYILGCMMRILPGVDYDLKYCSINPMPIRRAGSIELRHFNPIITSGKMVEVTDLILELYDAAKNMDTSDGISHALQSSRKLNPMMDSLNRNGSLNVFLERL